MKFKLPRITRLLLFILATYGLYLYMQAPESVPSHFDEEGEVDALGSRIIYLAIPFGTTLLYVFLHSLSRDRKLSENEEKAKRLAKNIQYVNLGLVGLALFVLYRLANA